MSFKFFIVYFLFCITTTSSGKLPCFPKLENIPKDVCFNTPKHPPLIKCVKNTEIPSEKCNDDNPEINNRKVVPCLTKRCCGVNEFYTPYALVTPRACDNIGKVLGKKNRCGCACLPGYIRESSAKGAKCIKTSQCPCLSLPKTANNIVSK